MDLANSLPFSRTRSPRSALQSESYGHLFGHLADGGDLHRRPRVIESIQIHHLAPPNYPVRRTDRVLGRGRLFPSYFHSKKMVEYVASWIILIVGLGTPDVKIELLHGRINLSCL